MQRCFDLHVYYANWGSRTLMLRVDADAFAAKAAAKYDCDRCKLHQTKEHFVIELNFSSDDFDDSFIAEEYAEGEWADQLTPVRDLLQAGDLRPLYLGWLAGVQWREESDEAEPPLPPGLKKLPKELKALAAYLRIENRVLTEAAKLSPELAAPSNKDFAEADHARWIAALPSEEKDHLLLQAMQGDAAGVSTLLQRRFRQEHSKGNSVKPLVTGRTVEQIVSAAK
jgi:hypothetical protein